MRILYLAALSLFLSTTLHAQQKEDVEVYDYKTHLNGGYHIQFTTDDDTEYIFLTKNGKQIAELYSIDKGQPYKNLGYAAADFKACFVLVHSYGSGNPNPIELFSKATGKNILKKAAWWIGADEKKGYLLYSNQDVPTEKDKMIFYNINTGQRNYFVFPKDILDEPMILGRIQIKSISSHVLTIEYEAHEQTKIRQYSF